MITLTETARDAIAGLLADLPGGGLRVSAILGGCAGIRYGLALEAAPAPGDVVVHDGDAALFVDPHSAASLNGVTLGFAETVGGGGFTFDNPNAIGRCSCGDPNAACARQGGDS